MPGGSAEGVVFPENEKEVVEFLKDCNERKVPVTVSGGGTGLVGGRVPMGGWVLATDRLTRIKQIVRDPSGKNSFAVLEPGILLKKFQDETVRHGLFYPPDPTSRGFAFTGGTVSTNATGPRTFKYGATRDFIRRLRMVLASGEVLDLKRGQFVSNREDVLEIPLSGSRLQIKIPIYAIPSVKHVAGYFTKSALDAIDLFIGSEGTLGVITEIETELLLLPAKVFSFVAFFSSEESSWKFVDEARAISKKNEAIRNDAGIQARALEYLDGPALDFIREEYPQIPRDARAAVYLEQECQNETETMLWENWSIVLERYRATLDEFWTSDSEDSEKEEMLKTFRHRIGLKVKEFLIQTGQSKVGTDMAVPHERFAEFMRYQKTKLEELKLPSVTFGHIGDSHVHLNILPRNEEEHKKAGAVYGDFIRKALALGGTISGEHGIGKLKRPYLVEMFGEKTVREMAAVKKALDPKGILGRGNLFSEEMLR